MPEPLHLPPFIAQWLPGYGVTLKVPSTSRSGKSHRIAIDYAGTSVCSCEGFHRWGKCKHLKAATVLGIRP
jgi:hypothetical protein